MWISKIKINCHALFYYLRAHDCGRNDAAPAQFRHSGAQEACTGNVFEPISHIPLGAILQRFHLQARNADFIAFVFAIISLCSISTFFPPPHHSTANPSLLIHIYIYLIYDARPFNTVSRSTTFSFSRHLINLAMRVRAAFGWRYKSCSLRYYFNWHAINTERERANEHIIDTLLTSLCAFTYICEILFANCYMLVKCSNQWRTILVFIYISNYIYYTLILWRCACKQFLPAIYIYSHIFWFVVRLFEFRQKISLPRCYIEGSKFFGVHADTCPQVVSRILFKRARKCRFSDTTFL